MRNIILVLVCGVIFSWETCIAGENAQAAGSGKEQKTTDVVQDQQTRDVESEIAVARITQASERTLWEMETKRLSLANAQRRLDELMAKLDAKELRATLSERQYAMFRDTFSFGSNITTNIIQTLLAIFAVAISIYGFLIYKFLFVTTERDHARFVEKIENEHQEHIVEAQYKVAGNVYLELTNAYYTYYRRFYGGEKREEYESAVLLAMNFAQLAIKEIRPVRDNVPGKQERLWKAQHAYFYHCASLPDLGKKAAALTFALNELPGIVDKFRANNADDWYYAKETRCWILIRCGSPEQQKQGKTELQEILDNLVIPEEIRTEIRRNYEMLGITFS